MRESNPKPVPESENRKLLGKEDFFAGSHGRILDRATIARIREPEIALKGRLSPGSRGRILDRATILYPSRTFDTP
jgi:hypothetical protein